MASKTVNCAEIHGLYEKALLQMPTGEQAKEGDVVICSVNGKNFSEPCALGVVVRVKNVNLPPGHEDGEKGELFVLPFDKRLRGGKSLKNLLSKFFKYYIVPILYILPPSPPLPSHEVRKIFLLDLHYYIPDLHF